MGWTYFRNADRRDVVHNIRFQLRKGLVASCVRDNIFWGVYALPEYSGHPDKKIIVCYLLQKSGTSWGYKDMDETVMPYYFNCPKKYLEIADDPITPMAAEWRRQQRNVYNDQAERKLAADLSKHIRELAR